MPNMNLVEAITKLKKINVAMRAVTENRKTKSLEWKHNLSDIENDFKTKLTDEDKENLLKNKNDLKKDLAKNKFHSLVINKISNIFQFEEKRRNDDKIMYIPTKESAQVLNDSAELTGLLLKAYDISTSQIRRYLDSLRKIKATTISPDKFNSSDVLLQQVKIAYAAGRDSDLTFFYEIMKPAIIEGCKDYHYFEQLLRFVEAIIAYHRFYKGED